ncbi:MAG: hypothetical protein HY822_09505 [Acidobacteria bacterium]|nr:hypothetical protein [Acidobacteriota bacterium]
MKIKNLTVVLASAAIAFAQGPRGPRTQNAPNHPASVLNMAKVQTVTGAISAVDVAYGAQYPSITVGKAVIKVAPVWFFLDHDFELKAGGQVSVSAAPSTLPNDAYLYAISITKGQAAITLRDASGVPLWSGPRGGGFGNQEAARTGTGCIDPASIRTLSGTIDKVSMGLGIEMPTLVLKTSDGKLVTLKIGPEWVLLAADFELKAGDQITAKVGLATCSNEEVALQLTNAAGATVILRGDA